MQHYLQQMMCDVHSSLGQFCSYATCGHDIPPHIYFIIIPIMYMKKQIKLETTVLAVT
jgi:hypothetical protein